MNLKRLSQFLADAIRSTTSRERLKGLFRISLYRNAVYLMVNSAVTAIVGFVFWLLAARLYSAEEVGLASAAIAAATILALVSTLGLGYGLIRFLPSSGKNSNAMINSCFTIGGLVSMIMPLIFLAGLSFWSPALIFLRQTPLFFCTFIALVAALTLSTLLNHSFIAERRAGFALAQGIINSLLRLIVLVLFAAFFDVFGILASWGIAAIVALAVGIFFFLPRVQAGYRSFFAIRRQVINEMVHFSSANYIAALLWVAPASILPLLILNLLGAEASAYFYIAWGIASLLFAISIGSSFSLFAEGSAEGSYGEEKLSRDTKRSLKLTSLLLVPAIVLMFLIGDKLLLLFGAAYSENATTLLWILALSAVPLSLNYIYFGVKRVEMKMKNVIGLTAFVAVATLALSYILLPQMGILGVGVAWLTSQGLVAVFIMMGFLKKLFGVEAKHV